MNTTQTDPNPTIVCACFPPSSSDIAPRSSSKCVECVSLVREQNWRIVYCSDGNHANIVPPESSISRHCTMHLSGT